VNNNNIEDRIRSVMSAVFEVPVEEINEESSTDTIKSWDSLKHMSLIFAFEEEFETEFTENEIIMMLNYALIKSAIIARQTN